MTQRNLEGKTALITGASKGLGRAMAIALAGAGARLALVSRDAEQLSASAAEARVHGVTAEIFQADIAREEQVLLLERDVIAKFGRIDILINNAGINIRKPIVEFTLEEWNQVIGTNLTSVFLMCRSFAPHMTGRGYGRIINLTSIMSHVSLPGRVAYSSSKAGLLGLTRSLALELAEHGITVNGISPGPIATEMNTALMNDPVLNQQFTASIPLGRWGQVEEIGGLALYLCSEEAGFITGTDILIDGGWCAR